MTRSTFLASGLLSTSMAFGAQAGLVAQWTFNDGDSGDLDAQVGGFSFAEAVSTLPDRTTTYNADGTLTLGTGQMLVASGINSTDMSSLQTNNTIWLRMKVEANGSAPTASSSFLAGLLNATAPADWAQFTLAARHGSSNNVNGYAYSTVGANEFYSPHQTLPSGFFSLALVFDDGVDSSGTASPTQSTVRVYLDGNQVATTRSVTSLQAFQSLAIGRLKSALPSGDPAPSQPILSFDEVRVYDTALSTSELDQITAVPVPEPGTTVLMGGAVVLVMLRRRGPQA